MRYLISIRSEVGSAQREKRRCLIFYDQRASLFDRRFFQAVKCKSNKRENRMRQISRGICALCQRELSKSAMTRHLETCWQSASTETSTGRSRSIRTRTFHLLVEGRFLPMYWLHLEIVTSTPLATLDRFLRDIWLECCGHLSAFTIEGVRY